jgi:hypothetical protein
MINGYEKLIKIMRNQGAKYNSPGIQLAKVVNPPPNFMINTGDVQISKENIYISEYLLNTYKREINLPSSPAEGNTSEGSIQSISISKADLNFVDTLQTGDIIAVMPTADMQTWIVLDKVVRL